MACVAHMNPSRIAALGLLSSDGPYASMPPPVLSQMFALTDEEQQELRQQESEGGGRQLTAQMTLTRAQQNYTDLHAAFSSLSKPDRRELALADLEHAACQGLDKVSITHSLTAYVLNLLLHRLPLFVSLICSCMSTYVCMFVHMG